MRHQCQRATRRGFSLVELTITMLIVGILAAVASPGFSHALCHYRTEAAAARIVADLNYIRRYAANTSTNRAATFVTDKKANSSYKTNGATGVPDPHHPANNLIVHFKQKMPGVELVSVSFDGTSEITFNQYGLPLAGDPLTSLTSGTIVISHGMSQWTIVIDPATGKAAVQ
jgi:prepilin-type N-terminal cleavage/methylation domain-containing protein